MQLPQKNPCGQVWHAFGSYNDAGGKVAEAILHQPLKDGLQRIHGVEHDTAFCIDWLDSSL